MAVIIFILLLSGLVIIHELGHFLVARWRGVKVKEFGFGYPPRLFRLGKWRGTQFSFNAIPFGGFVRLEGEEYDSSDTAKQPAPGAFYAQPAWSRLAVIIAGPLANLLYGLLIFSIVFSIVGIPRSLEARPRIETVSPGSPAAVAGLVAGQEVIGFNVDEQFTTTPKITDVVDFVAAHPGETVTMTLTEVCAGLICPSERVERELLIRTPENTPSGEGSIGIIFADFYFETGPWPSRLVKGIVYGCQEAIALGWLIVEAVGQLFKDLIARGRVPTEIAGPIGIVDQASRNNLLTQGWLPLLQFSGLLSINLGIMNLLPIPALDGGRVLFILLEKIVGKRRIQSIEGYAHYGGFIILLGLIILVSLRDVAQLFRP